ncbi:MAG: UDP-N-acetylmuramoyl-L-alanyl-D-glutamate--2,6-diaminopimelate ligase [Bacteroidales bacterium]|nr:UDP-N-acetylmuramoyl-L-alanyl-D-glutamate--2,6-diaminopimelate ligase [Bacteroidales bacterium]
MKLGQIIENSGARIVNGGPDTEITAITNDSRKVAEGSLFIAVKGFAVDGHDFIDAALAKGAAAVVSADRHALAVIASNFYGNPSEKLELVGITGTNGKTTTVTLLYRLFTKLGYKCGLLSTIANYVGERGQEAVNTTSDPITINSLMAEMVAEGCRYCFMEVSSIGVEQERVAGLKFKAGIFSNLTHDHLDYHKTFAEYLRCKKLFFDQLPSDAVAITNIDDKNGMVMVQNTKAKVVTYSCRAMADHRCKVLEQSFDGMLLRIDGTESWVKLIGLHNAYNILAIYTTAVILGTDPMDALVAVSALESAPGRLENIKGPRDISVIIDYAHTPDAMENVLGTLRAIAPERELICLFGCGGDRDRTKRPEMAAVAQKMADRIVITSDNSRTENTSDIIAEIKTGLDKEGRAKTICIEDRAEAIRMAIMTAKDGATILLAGKGHETYQIIGKEKRHFDEKEIVAEVFADMNE